MNIDINDKLVLRLFYTESTQIPKRDDDLHCIISNQNVKQILYMKEKNTIQVIFEKTAYQRNLRRFSVDLCKCQTIQDMYV